MTGSWRYLGFLSFAVVLIAPLGADAAATPPPREAPAQAEHGNTAGGAAEHGKAAHGSADPLSMDPDLAWWTLGVFLLLLAILWKFAWGPIAAGLDKREETVAEHLAAAERAHQDAKQLLADYERKLAGAAGQVSELLAEARRDAEHTKQDILGEARAGADAERARALREIESATDASLKLLAERSASLAVELAGKIMRSKLTADEHARLVQEAVGRFQQQAASRN